MKMILLEKLICPACLPREYPLTVQITEEAEGDISEGVLRCRECHGNYPIVEGLAFLAPEERQDPVANKYELDEVVSSYLWSHYGDLLDDEEALDAYVQWASRITPHSGIALDLGGPSVALPLR